MYYFENELIRNPGRKLARNRYLQALLVRNDNVKIDLNRQ